MSHRKSKLYRQNLKKRKIRFKRNSFKSKEKYKIEPLNNDYIKICENTKYRLEKFDYREWVIW